MYGSVMNFNNVTVTSPPSRRGERTSGGPTSYTPSKLHYTYNQLIATTVTAVFNFDHFIKLL